MAKRQRRNYYAYRPHGPEQMCFVHVWDGLRAIPTPQDGGKTPPTFPIWQSGGECGGEGAGQNAI